MIASQTADELMRIALDEARRALDHDDVPVGAIVVRQRGTGPEWTVVGRGHNRREVDGDPTAHAELLALQDAAASLGTWRLDDCVLVVTLEPCPMCAGAAVNSRVATVIFGAADAKAGAAGTIYNITDDPRLNHRCEVVRGVHESEAAELLSAFFRSRRG